jgi:3-hydroxy acid dehydrogenase / malonic semialdehyde reductase
MSSLLHDHTALVTGATAGFGVAIARRLHGAGARVVLAARRTERLDALQAELGAERVHTLTLDVRQRQAVFAGIDGLPQQFRDLSILVNNAGLALGVEPAPSADLDNWDTMIETNISGLTYVTRAVLPGMVARKRGHVVNLGSVAGTYPYPGGNAYGATKAFVSQFSLNLRADLLGTGVRVSSIEPGMAETEFGLVRYKGDADKAAAVYKGMQPLTAEDVAESVLWCCTLPAHVNINRVEMMPTAQAFGGFAVHRQ